MDHDDTTTGEVRYSTAANVRDHLVLAFSLAGMLLNIASAIIPGTDRERFSAICAAAALLVAGLSTYVTRRVRLLRAELSREKVETVEAQRWAMLTILARHPNRTEPEERLFRAMLASTREMKRHPAYFDGPCECEMCRRRAGKP